MKRLLNTLLIILLAGTAAGQDHLYSQFFNSPMYLNPALNGQFDGDLRLNFIYRNQWSTLAGSPKYFTASIDYNLPQYGGGLGLMVTRGTEGSAYLVKNNVSVLYSYSVGNDLYTLSLGLQAGVTNRSVNWNALVFSDQIDPRLGYDPSMITNAEMPAYNNKFYFDSGAGVNLLTGEFMLGIAAHHINRPNESFSGVKATLPMRFTGHLSYRWDLNKYENLNDDERSYIIPSVLYFKEATAQSITAGLQFKKRGLNAGLWYRSAGSFGPSAVSVSLIFDLFVKRDGGEKLRIGLSHDAPMRSIGYGNTSGTTEGSISYETTLPNRLTPYQKFNSIRHVYDFY